MTATARPRQLLFDPPPEIFATDAAGSFLHVLTVDGEAFLDTQEYDESRFVFSIWHPSEKRSIDLERGYVELRVAFDGSEHWTRIAEVEPVVPPYAAGDSFDGWLVLPVLGSRTAYALMGSGLEPRARLQLRASAYFVS